MSTVAPTAQEVDRFASPTGLIAEDLAELEPHERRRLAEWTAGKAGDDDGRPWWPAAIRRLPLEDRIRQAFDPMEDAAWCERERRRVERSVEYFVRSYGHLQPGEGSAPIPFEMWPEQAEVLHDLATRLRVLILKARQLGLTWLVLHYAFWKQAFDPATPNAKILGLSKHGDDANKLLGKARRINALLPPYLRQEEDPETRGSFSRFKLKGRGTMISLTGSPAAARSESATIAILDEYGFIKNAKAGATSTAVEPTVGDHGQIFKLSTGNGRTGDGAALADDWAKATKGESDFKPVFLRASTDPARTPEWRALVVGRYRSEEEFLQEHPETPDQALGGEGTVKVYETASIAAAVKIGKALAELEQGRWYETMIASEGLELGTDWGDFQTFTTYEVALPGAGFYVVDELAQHETEPEDASKALLTHDAGDVDQPRIIACRADSSPAGTNRTCAKVLQALRAKQPRRFPEQHVKVPFGIYKEGGGDRRNGVNTVAFIKNRLRASARFVAEPGWEERLTKASGLAAIHPRCKTLVAQMEALERDPKTGKVKKPALDPKRLEAGDHGPDALVANNYKRAEQWTATLATTE